jgi:hypothetical protein
MPESRPKRIRSSFGTSKTVSFRVRKGDEAAIEILAAEAKKRSITIGDLARLWVLDRINDLSEPKNWEGAIQSVHSHLMLIRKDMALGFENTLAASGKLSPEEARAWAERNFYRE